MKEFLECGKIVTTHGIKGELKVEPWCDTPDYLKHFKTLYLGGEKTPLSVEQCRVQKNMVLLKVKGIDTMNEANALRGKLLFLRRADAPIDEGDYFIQDLIGLSVEDADTGESYGALTDVLQTGANDVYELTFQNGRTYLIPAIGEVVLSVDLEGGVMKIRPLKGLFDDEI